ncbi:hypothetical protein W909_05200 [Dickeya zeae EC1]|nr:hypothetical protein W909_05200 [Dickeya zeae EC1]
MVQIWQELTARPTVYCTHKGKSPQHRLRAFEETMSGKNRNQAAVV